ncbi:Tyrosinase domain containing protein [Pyrenophora tritici-repentis]|uniref:Tyrosinase domain containing protein n=1 Tax=Pyrenophora tritici-repentis TaxID=45151 RepID=A0A316ZMR3_9PLEO|nr:Tyrosinase domain containing protein [Pyrenophora tritici-repentis]KAF7568464.1 Tyrosinase domain containing protein [Pyrenophora tritici-repentis]KAG9376579.1 Tyrosinase domain containing protein [Pyrenophora tritici-repentis]KAI0583234.1 Tyrosinase domain-containing protein [Pyrenophora tritici-repentis]KAI0583923.1 Tyrosinase domain-containing protein [Pyrenophora tritici-repentis]
MAPTNLRALYALLVSLSLLSVLCAAGPVEDLLAKCRPIMDAHVAKSQTCTKDKVQIRREWGDLPVSNRHAYINAVKCLINRPSKLRDCPGCRNRYDDFVAMHMKRTGDIHFTGSFLSAHRLYTTAFEHALQTECGYNGTQPYWNWGRFADNIDANPLFDGSNSSISGQGQHQEHPSNRWRPAGKGGGCIASGPFVGLQVNLGPIDLADGADKIPKNSRRDGLGYNPRCVKRDLTSYLTTRFTHPQQIADFITKHKDIKSFQDDFQAFNGMHSVGHLTISGDPGSDIPFWFHHAMVDLVWALWQCQDFEHRQQVMAGPAHRDGPGPQQTLNDTIDFDVVNIGRPYKLKELMSTVDGPFCYLYE